jgi:predicted ATP-dependent endonuclease of OLD family
MRLLKFRVQNYKSIRDSGDCWLASDLTVLAGKNESGKTAILEALRDFDPREPVAEAARPIDQVGPPLLEATFELDNDELDALLEADSPELRSAVRPIIRHEGLVLLKNDSGQYRFGENLTTAIAAVDAAEADRAARAEELRAEAARHEAEERARQLAVEEEGEGEDEDELGDEDEEEDDDALGQEADTEPEERREPLLERAVKRIPRFVFFSSFDQVLPFEITFARAKTNASVQDFAKVAGLDLAAVSQITDTQERKNILATHSAELSGNFKRFWHQEAIRITASSEGQTLVLGIEEEGRTYTFKAEQRSKGLQWFLAFYLRLRAEGGYERVILIDEPGLYLHARAQQDVLEVFEELAADAQIVFSTHSPYLLDPDRLDRIRLVVKDGGTVIQGKVQAGADMETLTPIITAVGLDAPNQFAVAGTRNAVLEGITDYFYLQALRFYVPNELHEGLSLIPTVGAQNVPKIISLLIGWNLRFAAVLDNDNEGNKVANTLRKDLSVDETQIVFTSLTGGESTEDIFTKAEFKRHVLGETGATHTVANSKHVKSGSYDGALLARLFFAKVKADPASVALSQGTLSRAAELFERIAAAVGVPT